ncbi:MAG: dipeptidase PepV [Firmicutes bacterium]|nr:dipeptidase PepV [Bacillota bacterium]
MPKFDLQPVYHRLEGYRAEMSESLSRLIAFPSVAVRTQGNHPFGDAVQQAYEAMLEMAAEEGFFVCNLDNFGGHFDLPGKGDQLVGIVGHLDVVPEGDNWDFPPYGGEITDGYVCGRGSTDDKGPVIACFYAMKALKEAGFVPDKTIRMILGLDEESGWEGMKHYVAFADRLPDCGFTPDGDFPVLHGEKGFLVFNLARKFGRTTGKGLDLRSFTGGTAANAVPDFARAVLLDTAQGGYGDIRKLLTELKESRGWRIQSRGIGKSLEITVTGTSAHGARPEEGENAISILMEILGHLNFVSDEVTEFIRFYNHHIGFELNGQSIGCALEDEPSGKLIWNVGKIELDQKSVQLTVNVRYPVTAEMDQVYDGIAAVVDPYDIGIVKIDHKPPIYFPADDPMIETLVEIYRRHTGDEKSQPLVIGGGTYARAMDNIVAFGARFPGEPDLAHQKNEKISVDNLVLLSKIYADAIAALAGEAEEAAVADDAAPAEESAEDKATGEAEEA